MINKANLRTFFPSTVKKGRMSLQLKMIRRKGEISRAQMLLLLAVSAVFYLGVLMIIRREHINKEGVIISEMLRKMI